MDTIRLWVTGLVAAAIIGAVVLALTPSGGAEKAVKTIVSVFLISSMLLPFVKGEGISLDFDIENQTSAYVNSEDIMDTVSQQFEKKLIASVENILWQNGIQTHSVSIDININGEEISVERVRVVLKKESADKVGEAKAFLEQELSVSADVIVENTEE